MKEKKALNERKYKKIYLYGNEWSNKERKKIMKNHLNEKEWTKEDGRKGGRKERKKKRREIIEMKKKE